MKAEIKKPFPDRLSGLTNNNKENNNVFHN